jgi:hypothetical protein
MRRLSIQPFTTLGVEQRFGTRPFPTGFHGTEIGRAFWSCPLKSHDWIESLAVAQKLPYVPYSLRQQSHSDLSHMTRERTRERAGVVDHGTLFAPGTAPERPPPRAL